MKRTDLNYQIIDHIADLGIIVKGTDLKDLFIRAAYAMTDLMVEGDIGENGALREITIKGEDLPDLMVRWLGEVLYLFAGERLITDTVEIGTLSPTKLVATLSLADFKPEQHRILREIQAVTYHQISVERKDGWWEGRIILDI